MAHYDCFGHVKCILPFPDPALGGPMPAHCCQYKRLQPHPVAWSPAFLPKQKKIVERSNNFPTLKYNEAKKTITQANATVLKKVAEMVKHRTLILTTDPAEIAQEAATVCYHSRESDLLLQECKYKKQTGF